MFELDIFIHLEAVDRTEWTGAPDDRPLTEMGLTQAEHLAAALGGAALGGASLDAIVSSPALRCRQSLEPLSRATGLPIEIVPGFKDTGGFRAPDGWAIPDSPPRDPLGGAHAAGSAYRALRSLVARYPEGRVVLCSYGDVVPALLAFLSGAHELDMPERKNEWGAIWAVHVGADTARVDVLDPPASFPHSERDYFPLGARSPS